MFRDRRHAGQELVHLLSKYLRDPQAIVIGLPRGGVVTAHVIAKSLHLPLDIICPRKIGAPGNPELAIGAITETGEGIWNTALIIQLSVPKEHIIHGVEKEKVQALRRLNSYRQGRPPRELKGKTVILVDDGLATGSTMKAAIRSAKLEGAKRVVVAVPVSPQDTLEEIQKLVDEVVCVSNPSESQAVGQFYKEFSATEDEEVIRLLL